MQMEQLRKDMMAAMKARDKERKDAISSLVSAVKKNAILMRSKRILLWRPWLWQRALQ